MNPKTLINRIFSLLIAFSVLLGSLVLTSSAQVPPPEVAGPGWHNGTADPVSPDEARQVLSRRPTDAARHVAGLPASETEATPEIQALARALENDPKLIFDYVHNHVEYIPTFGSVNGATATLLAGRGNDWDQTSLFIALMRAAGYTADYVVGDVTYSTALLANWLGVGNAAVGAVFAYGGVPVTNLGGAYRITRAWAQATIGSQTYVFDPAMKEYTDIAGIDLTTASGYDRDTFMADAQEGAIVAADLVQYMNEANVQADLITYSMNLVDYIQANLPDATLAEVIGGREILATEMTVYPTDLPYALDVTNESTYPTIPDAYRHTLRVEHRGIDHTFKTYEIAGQRVSIFYDDADNYKPILRVDGTTIATGNATSPGNWYDLTLTVDHPYAANGGTYADQSGAMQLVSGSDYVIVHDFGAASADIIASRNRLLTQYVQDGYADDSEAVRGEGLWLMGLTYCYENHLFTRLLGQVGEGIFIQHHLLGRIGQEEGYSIDLPLGTTSFAPSGGASAITAHRAYAMMGSALEHGMLEQMQGSDRKAVSSIKLLQLNNAAGDMTFLADAGNWNSVQDNLTDYHWAALNLIEDDINSGNTVVLPQNGAINLNQWYGVGVISYKGSSMGMWIGGGLFGGSGTGIWDILTEALLKLLKELLGEMSKKIETEVPESDDPVDMFSGAFHVETLDLTAGPAGLLELAFSRSYSSRSNDDLGPLGYGWNHNQQTSLAFHHDYKAGLGQRQPTDAAGLIVYAQMILDVLENEDNIQGWMTADLATEWAMEQLIDNAVTAHFGDTTVEYVLLADGAYNPPPGIYWELLQNGDYHYAQGPGNTCMIFDADGRGRVWTDANGNTLTYTYDGDGQLLSVGAPTLGQTLTLVYSGTLLTSVSDQAGRAVTFEYTGDELTTFRDAEGNATHYSYDSNHRLVSVTQPRGNTIVTNVYDELGRVQTQADALGNTTTFYFSGFRNAEVYADGGRMMHYFNARGQAIGSEDALGNRAQMAYDGLNHLRTMTDRLGDAVSYTYDPASGQLATMTSPAGDTLSYTYTPQSYTCANPLNSESVTLTTYNPTRVDYADGSYETLSYDARGNLASHTDLAGKIWQYEHNTRGQQTLITNPTGGQTEYTYNADGTLASSTDTTLGVTTYSYDAYLRQNRVTHPDGSFVQTVFDLDNRITSLTDERGQPTTYEYDANGNLLKTTDPLGAETTYVYDLMDQVTQETNRRGKTTFYTYDEMNRPASDTDPNGNITQYGYDSHGWLDWITDPDGHTLQIEYDAEGLKTALTTPLGYTVTFGYDSQGRVVTTTGSLGNQTGLTRDELGRITASNDPEGRTTQYTYDARGLTAAVTLPDGATTAYSYNDLGLLSTARDPGGNEWEFAYIPMGQLQSHTDPLGHEWGYDSYDQRGFLTQVAYPTGDTQSLTYDAAGNIIRQQHSSGPDLHFAYDELSRLVATNGISLTYSEVGQVIATTDQETGHTFGAAYDDGGRLETVSYSNGLFTVTYQYNARDLLTRVSDDLTGVSVHFTHDDDGRLIGVQRSNGVDATFTWDAASRLTRIQEGTLIDLQYTHNAAGKVTQAVMDLPLDPGSYIVTDTIEYTFDAASQVSNSGYTYDAQGRLTADPQHTLRQGSGQAYTWDGASRLTGVDGVSLTYNGLGDLLTRTESGQMTRYFYNHALRLTPIVAEQDVDTGVFQRFYVWTPNGALLYMVDAQDGNQVYFYHFDRTGSTLALTDQAGTLTDAYAYEPYGKLLHHQGSNDQPFTYVGQWGVRQDGDSGSFYHIRARYYDAVTGRFISREPLWPQVGNAQAINPYQYAYQNPGTYIDVTGWAPTPAEYAQWRISQAGDFIDAEEASMIAQDINQYINEWVVQNIGDPARFELTPAQYGRYLIREAGEVIDEGEQRRIAEDLNWYSNEWIRRNIGDPDKFELTPEQYARWLMREAGEVIDENEMDMIAQELAAYKAEWSRKQSEAKTIKYIVAPAVSFGKQRPRANNAQQPVRLGGFYSVMP